jgi:hypothetical protein
MPVPVVVEDGRPAVTAEYEGAPGTSDLDVWCTGAVGGAVGLTGGAAATGIVAGGVVAAGEFAAAGIAGAAVAGST